MPFTDKVHVLQYLMNERVLGPCSSMLGSDRNEPGFLTRPRRRCDLQCSLLGVPFTAVMVPGPSLWRTFVRASCGLLLTSYHILCDGVPMAIRRHCHVSAMPVP